MYFLYIIQVFEGELVWEKVFFRCQFLGANVTWVQWPKKGGGYTHVGKGSCKE